MFVPLPREMFKSSCFAIFVICSERQYAIQGFGKSLLCVCDYLNLAITSVPKDKLEGDAADKVCFTTFSSLRVDSRFLASGCCDDSKGIG